MCFKNFKMKESNKRVILIYLSLFFIFLLYIILIFFFYGNESYGFTHPDDHGEYLIAKNLFNKGTFCIDNSFLETNNLQLYTPEGTLSKEKCWLPVKSLG